MLIVECNEQRSPEWYAARRGKITASAADRLLTTAKQKTYAQELLVEILTNEESDNYVNEAMQWGIDNEAAAVDWYWWTTSVAPEHVSFCLYNNDDGPWKRLGGIAGASPDGLIATDGLIEIKCPTSRVHLEHLENGPSEKYVAQIQWQLFVTNRKWCDFVSFDPRFQEPLNGCIHRIERDEDAIEKLAKGAIKVLDYMDKFKTKVFGRIQ